MRGKRWQYLLHNTSLALGEGDVATRLILDKLDLNLAALTARLVVVIIIVLGAHATALGAAVVRAVAGLLQVIVTRREFLLADGSHIGHGWRVVEEKKEVRRWVAKRGRESKIPNRVTRLGSQWFGRERKGEDEEGKVRIVMGRRSVTCGGTVTGCVTIQRQCVRGVAASPSSRGDVGRSTPVFAFGRILTER